MEFCRSRNNGRRCARELAHRGLHRHRTIMWADAAADPARCSGSAASALPAALLPSGFPGGRALCAVCQRFIELSDGVLVEHDTTTAPEPESSEWFNTHGW